MAAGDALLERGDLAQRVLPFPADLGPLDRGAPSGLGFVQELRGEQAFGEALLEGGEGFGGAGHGGGFSREIVPVGALWVP